MLIRAFLATLLASLCALDATAQDTAAHVSDCPAEIETQCVALSEQIRETYPFAGLAFYYNQVSVYTVTGERTTKLLPGQHLRLKEGEWLALTGRLDVLLIREPGLEALITESGALTFTNIDAKSLSPQQFEKSELKSVAPELDSLRYAHLWTPLASLSKLCETLIEALSTRIGLSWGWAVLAFALLLRVVLLPLSLITDRWQRRVKDIQEQLAPKLAEIKANFDGEEAHTRLMKAHSDLGVSPFFTLKPMLGTLVQIPFLIAAFNALGEMPQLRDQPFLWIQDLAYPDALFNLPASIPFLGDTFNLLPVIMTVVTLVSGSSLFGGRPSTSSIASRGLIAAAFFVLFFPFPAAMILFWTLTNLLQLIQSRITGRARNHD